MAMNEIRQQARKSAAERVARLRQERRTWSEGGAVGQGDDRAG